MFNRKSFNLRANAFNIFCALLLSICFVVSYVPFNVNAEGTTTIALSKNSAAVGDTVYVTIQGTDSSTIKIKYNATVLEYVSCDASGVSADGNAITFSGKNATVKFKAATEGTANVIVSSDTLSGSSTQIAVGASGQTTDSNSAATNTDAQSDATTGADAQPENNIDTTAQTDTTSQNTDTQASSDVKYDFEVDGVKYVISERYTSAEVPAGFNKTRLTIHNSTYNEPANNALTLLYLKDATNIAGKGQFFIYNAEADSVQKMYIFGDNSNYVLSVNTDQTPSPAFVATTCSVAGVDVPCYAMNDASSGFYFVYGYGPDMTANWYQYDSQGGTIQRLNTELLNVSSVPEEETEEVVTEEVVELEADNLMDTIMANKKMLAIVAFVVVVLVIIIINVIVFRRSDDDDYDEYDDEEDDESIEKPIVEAVNSDRIVEEDNSETEKTEAEIEDDSLPKIEITDISDEDEISEPSEEDDAEDEEEYEDDVRERKSFFGRLFAKDEDIFDEEDEEAETEEEVELLSPSTVSEIEKESLDILDLNDL